LIVCADDDQLTRKTRLEPVAEHSSSDAAEASLAAVYSTTVADCLFRQSRPDDWLSVVQEIRSELLLENGPCVK